MEHSDTDALREVKELCVKIYRATNMRFQQIAKMIMRNKQDELRKLVQMRFCYDMPQHMSLTLTKLSVQNGRQQTLFVDAPDK